MGDSNPVRRSPASRGGAGKPLGVVLVDPLPTVRAGLALLIEGRDALGLVGEASSSDDALEVINSLPPGDKHVVVVGLGLPGPEDAFWLIRHLRSTHPYLTVVGCGANSDPNVISRVLFVGADGFVDKNAQPEEFLHGLTRASEGEVVLVGPGEGAIGAIAAGIERQRHKQQILTERERGILTIAAEGVTAREIAQRLGLRERTVTTHLARIYAKLGVNSRVAAVTAAAKQGLVTVQEKSG